MDATPYAAAARRQLRKERLRTRQMAAFASSSGCPRRIRSSVLVHILDTKRSTLSVYVATRRKLGAMALKVPTHAKTRIHWRFISVESVFPRSTVQPTKKASIRPLR
jgi:hypothetical protein